MNPDLLIIDFRTYEFFWDFGGHEDVPFVIFFVITHFTFFLYFFVLLVERDFPFVRFFWFERDRSSFFAMVFVFSFFVILWDTKTSLL